METLGYLHLYAFNEQEEIGEVTLNPGRGLAALALTGASLLIGVQPSQAYGVRPGSVGPAVADLQIQLNQSGIPVAVDGIYGPQTRAAVLQFQTFYGLRPDGIVGVETMYALCNCDFLGGVSGSTNNFLPSDDFSSGTATYSPLPNIVSDVGNYLDRKGNSAQRPQQTNVPQRSQPMGRVNRSPQFFGVQPAAAAESASVRQEVPVEYEVTEYEPEQEFLLQESVAAEALPYVSEEEQMQEMLTQGQLEGRLW